MSLGETRVIATPAPWQEQSRMVTLADLLGIPLPEATGRGLLRAP